MRKLLLIFLIFLIMGAVSASDNLNSTADHLLKDTEYNSNIDDGDEMLVEENDYISAEVNVNESWSLNVYIDKYNSTVNDDLVNVNYNQLNIPASVMIGDGEVPLALGKHNIVYEFKFTNTTSVYMPDVYISDSTVYFNFNFIRSSKNPQNSIYRFNSHFNIVNVVEPVSTTFKLDDINITYSDPLSFNLNGLNSGKVSIYLDDVLFNSFEFDDAYCDDEIDTTKLEIGSYNLLCVIESDKVYGEYNVTADSLNSMINIDFTKSKIVFTPNRYITIINTTLNVCKFPDLNIIYVNAPPINITYTRSIPIYFRGEGDGVFTVYIDGKKVYNSSVLLSWENICYIPTKDGDGNYFDEGSHNITFEFTSSDKYSSFNPTVSWYNNALTFNFLDSHDSSVFLNDKYIINTKLNVINMDKHFIPIDSKAVVNIVHTGDIKLKIDNLNYYNLTVFVDDVEIYDGYTNNKTINIKTFLERSSIEETNERDIQTGSHTIRFEFKALYLCDVDVEFKDSVLNFRFNQKDSNIYQNGVYYQFNTSLIVSEKEKTVHILNVRNNTYFDDTEFVVKMDLYKPEDDDDWDDEGDWEEPIGTQDVGIIVSNENGIVYTGDNLMNLYENPSWNYDFENEILSKAGNYTMKIINLADNTYDTVSFEVKKAKRVFNKKYSTDDFNVLFTLDFSSCNDDLNSPCYITLNNKQKVINVKKSPSKSKKEVLFEDIDPGVYTATFTLKGNEIYDDVTLTSKVTVKKLSPTITYYKSGGNSLELTFDIDQSKTDAVLSVSAGGYEKKFTLNKNTKHLTVDFDNLKSGNYNVKIDFEGNERYTSKTFTIPFEITAYAPAPDSQPVKNTTQKGKGVGNNSGGIGTGSGDSNVSGNGNGTFKGKISLDAKGSGGDLGSQGSGNGEGAKSYEITKTIKKLDENPNSVFTFLIIALILLILSFIYEKRENDDSDDY